MIVQLVLALLLALAAPVGAVEPTLPQRFVQTTPPSYTPIRTLNLTSAAELSQYLTGAGSGGPPALGDEVRLTAGTTYTGNFILPKPTGTQPQPGGGGPPAATSRPAITAIASTAIAATFRPALGSTSTETLYVMIRTSDTTLTPGTRVAPADAAKMPRLIAPCCAGGANYAISIQNTSDVGYYWLMGLEVTSPDTGTFAGPSVTVNLSTSGQNSDLTFQPHHIVVDRSYIHANANTGTKFCLVLGGQYVAAIHSYITDCFLAGNADAMAIWVYPCSSGPFHIENNRLESQGENLQLGGSHVSCLPNIDGDVRQVPKDVTIKRNYIYKPFTWKADHASYIPFWDELGEGTVSVNGTAVTLTQTQPFFGSASLGAYLLITNGSNAGIFRRIASGSGLNWTLTSAFPTSVQSGAAFRYNDDNRAVKNCLETKGGARVLVEGNMLENCWGHVQGNSGIQITPRENGSVYDWTLQYNVILGCAACLGVSPFDNIDLDQIEPATKRMKWAHNLVVDHATPEMISLGGYDRGLLMSGGNIAEQPDDPEDWIIEHNTLYFGASNHRLAHEMLENSPCTPAHKVRRFVYKHNVAHWGTTGFPRGVATTCGQLGTDMLNRLSYDAGGFIRTYEKNAFVGPDAGTYDGSFTGAEADCTNNSCTTALVTGTQAALGFVNPTSNPATWDYTLSANIDATTVNISGDGLTVTRTSGTWPAAVIVGLGFKLDADATSAIRSIASMTTTTLTLATAYPGAPFTSQPGKVQSAFRGWVGGVDPGVDWVTLQSKISGVRQ